MQGKKVPIRTCVACKNSFPKASLLRIVKSDSGFVLEKSGKLNGRGLYICNNTDCLNTFIKNKTLNKIFKTNIGADVYEGIKEQFFENRSN